ncbi:hypothetical protein FB451DRAFT_1392948 [Mycena latifolia]|nr:hypothetical protein FB451DRAFT_1392948 [Mycena latifolia]
MSNWGQSSRLARAVIEKHVGVHQLYLSVRDNTDQVPTLVDLAAERLANSSSQIAESLDDVPPIILSLYIWRWHRIPYSALCRALLRLSSEGAVPETSEGNNVDEWILSNEKWLRDGNQSQWSRVSPSGRTIMRQGPLPGYEILCNAREPHITIQPSVEAFKWTFEHMSDGLLRNLNWSNLMVAGGIVLGTLLSVDTPDGQSRTDPRWASSDIDIYVYGLTPGKANEKIKHLFDTFRANLPPGTPTLVVRNCTTITFYARYPLRRIQIVLKLAESPKSVLLNFDLDVCAMGWDGTTLWMLPRAARALETGCSVFTMNLIRGHYLSDRRASTQERIFKYADKGYGIRILPSYISSLVTRKSAHRYPSGEAFLASMADREREWTTNEVRAATRRFGRSGRILECVMPRYAGYRASRCLKGFQIFMRCVTIWEMGQRGEVDLKQDIWAHTAYQDAMTTYDDAPNPRYTWDDQFTLAAFKKRIDASNCDEIQAWIQTDCDNRLFPHGVDDERSLPESTRMTYAETVDVLLSKKKDIKMPVLLPCELAVYANDLVSRAQARAGLPETKILMPAVPGFNFLGEIDPETDGLFFWRIGKDIMWQQLDRSIDEVFEVLYAFRKVNEQLRDGEAFQQERVSVELSRREVYDELDAFGLWVDFKTKPGPGWHNDYD